MESSVSRVLEAAYKNKLVIGAMCIAPVTVAKVLGKHGITVTIGNDKTVAKTIELTGARHQDTPVSEACIDAKNRIITTPAYMLAHSVKEVAAGAEAMVNAMVALAR